jgi:hypothetical protein
MFENNSLRLKSDYNYFIIIFFTIFLTFGLYISNDFGMAYDVLGYRQQGLIVLNHIGNIFFPELTKKIVGEREITAISDYYFAFSGVPFHSFIALIEKLFFDFETKKEVYYFKYKMNFLFNFIGCIFFYQLLKKRFKNKIIPIVGVLTLISSPRIFPELFYNPNDIPFMTSLIIFFYFANSFFKKYTLKNLFLLSFVSGFLISMRFVGIVFPGMLMLIYLIYNYFFLKKSLLYNFKIILLFSVYLFIFSYLLNPSLWNNLIHSLLVSLETSISYNSVFPKILYLGEFYDIKNLPWHYLPVWICISTPLVYLILIFIGLGIFLKNFIKKFNKNSDDFFNLFIFLSLIFCLMTGILISKSLINGWRHMYFLYPMLIYFSLFSFNLVKLRKFLLLLFILSFSFNIYWIFKNHPHQMVFFNSLAGKKLQNKFELDYWGLSIKSSLKEILKYDNKDEIKIIGMSKTRLNFTLFILNEDEKNIFKIVDNPNEADYIISVFNSTERRKDFIDKGYKIINDVKVDGIIINSTFKISD